MIGWQQIFIDYIKIKNIDI